MANKKFSEFELKTSTSDVSHIVGYNGADNVQITPANFVTTGGSGVFLPLAGGTMVGNTLHGDNVKSIYGTGGDLEIYHDGTHSRIKDVGSGNLTFNATDFIVNNSADSKQMMTIVDGGGVSLFHNASKKFETTSAGVTVTGDVTIAKGTPKLIFNNLAGGGLDPTLTADGSNFTIATSSVTPLSLALDTGNATFSGDVDLTANSAIFLNNSSNNNPVYLRNSGGNLASLQIGRGTSPGSNVTMVIDNSGNMGLGLTNPLFKLQVAGSVALDVMPGNQSEGIVRIGRYDANTTRYNDIKSFVSSTAASNYLKLSVHGGVENATVDVLTLLGSGNATFAGSVTINHNSGDSLVLTKSTTEPSMRFEGDTDKDFVLTVSGETFNITQNDGGTDILTLDHDTKNATFAGDVSIASKLIHAGDTNTYIEFPSTNDKIVLATNGSEKMRLDATGKLGIGLTNPGRILDVKASGGDQGIGLVQSGTDIRIFQAIQTGTGDGAVLLTKADGSDGSLIRGQGDSSLNGGDLKLGTASAGLVLKSANGTQYKITVADNGTVTSTAV